MSSWRYDSAGASGSGVPPQCPVCNGTGKVPPFAPLGRQDKCVACNGTGRKYLYTPPIDEGISQVKVEPFERCPACKGTGKIVSSLPWSEQNKCVTCNGTGFWKPKTDGSKTSPGIYPSITPCPICNGEKYNTIPSAPKRITCSACNGRGYRPPLVETFPPKGIGVFEECSVCHGTGSILIPQSPIQTECFKCHGTGWIDKENESPGCLGAATMLLILGVLATAL